MILKTNRLQLKKISENDCNRICELFQNEIIKKTYILPDFKSKEEVEKLFKMTKFTEDESILRFGRKLKKMGIEEELERLGAQRGDEVQILDYLFIFKD